MFFTPSFEIVAHRIRLHDAPPQTLPRNALSSNSLDCANGEVGPRGAQAPGREGYKDATTKLIPPSSEPNRSLSRIIFSSEPYAFFFEHKLAEDVRL